MTVIKRKHFLHNMDTIILIFVTLSLQLCIGANYAEKLIVYGACAIAYFYMFCKLFGNSGRGMSVTLAVVTSVLYIANMAAYNSLLRNVGFVSAFKAEFTDFSSLSWLKYPFLFLVVFVPCVFVAVKTLKGVRHSLHKRTMDKRRKHHSLMYELENLNDIFYMSDRTLSSFKLVNKNGAPLSEAQNEFAEILECRDFETNIKYLIFTNHDLDDNNSFKAFAAVYEHSINNPELSPVKTQEEFDMLEKILNKSWIVTV